MCNHVYVCHVSERVTCTYARAAARTLTHMYDTSGVCNVARVFFPAATTSRSAHVDGAAGHA